MKAILKIISVLFLVIGIIVMLSVILHRKHEKLRKEKEKIESLKKAQVPPDRYTKIYTLKKGTVITVKVLVGYDYTCSGGGKKYYHQAQNSKKEIWGDGQYHDAGKHVAYFDLSYYDEEITVVCEFIKKE